MMRERRVILLLSLILGLASAVTAQDEIRLSPKKGERFRFDVLVTEDSIAERFEGSTETRLDVTLRVVQKTKTRVKFEATVGHYRQERASGIMGGPRIIDTKQRARGYEWVTTGKSKIEVDLAGRIHDLDPATRPRGGGRGGFGGGGFNAGPRLETYLRPLFAPLPKGPASKQASWTTDEPLRFGFVDAPTSWRHSISKLNRRAVTILGKGEQSSAPADDLNAGRRRGPRASFSHFSRKGSWEVDAKNGMLRTLQSHSRFVSTAPAFGGGGGTETETVRTVSIYRHGQRPKR